MLKIQILCKLNNSYSSDPNLTMSLSVLTSDRALTLKFERSSHHSTSAIMSKSITLALTPNFWDIFFHFCEHCFKSASYE